WGGGRSSPEEDGGAVNDFWCGRSGTRKGSGVGRGVKEKQVSSADNLGEGSKHVDQAVGTNSTTSTPIVVTTGLGSYPTLSEVHGHSPTSSNEGDTNVAGTPAGNTPKLKDHIVVAMPKLVGEGFYTYKVRVGYE
nr:hypothetical protein [Tanacetum cinerariifolium]